MTTSYAATETDDENFLTTCQGCDKNFDDEDRLPLNLDCQHSMCITCIKRKSSKNKLVYCSTCPGRTNMVNRKVFDLKTNHCVLRLIAAEQEKAKLKADNLKLKIDSVRNKIWCSDCHDFGSFGCSVSFHKTAPLFEFLHSSLDSLISNRQDLSVSWNKILSDLKESQNILKNVAGSISSVLDLIQKRMKENENLMSQIQTTKMESGELPVVPNDLDLSDEELKNLAQKLEATTLRMKSWEDSVKSVSSHQQLKNFSLMENLTAVIQLDWKDPQMKSQTVSQISLLNKLPLSFTTSKYTSRCNDCVSVLSFLLMILAEEEAKSSTQTKQDSCAIRAENSNVDDSTDLVLSNATIRPSSIIPNSSDFHESVQPSTQEKSSNDDSNESDSDSSLSMESNPRAVRRNHLNQRRSIPIHPQDSDTEGLFSDQSSLCARSLITTRSALFATSALCGRSALSVQSRETVQASRPAQSTQSVQFGASVQASKSAPTSRSFRPERSVKGSPAVDHTKPFKCGECGKHFKEKFNLKRHVFTHSDERPFKCQYCLKGFKLMSNLKQHAVIHTGERPYRCQYCLKDFSWSNNMKRHANLCSSRPTK